jgi:hypothetical protein
MPTRYKPLHGREVDWVLYKYPNLEKALKKVHLRLSVRGRLLGATLKGCPKKPGPKVPPKSPVVLR